MAMRYLLDADWIIQVLAGRREAVLAHKRIHPEEIAVSYITNGEIYDVAYTTPIQKPTCTPSVGS